ncbi:hypothetical protein [Pseudoalteromonas sp. PPB1]|uniref:hypothetical protein n=1 Tax=Pseudoalteromonas sp. PPB1 TaxID=2756136 RepID=UPI001890E1EB|nr:hypothetical protein [Pseudoalteromonas sp. PPB1]
MPEIFFNSTMQSFVFSPLMGVIFGALFTGLTSKPSNHAPKTVVETRRVYIERRYRNSRNSSNDDGGGIFALLFLLIFVLWKYVQVAPLIHEYIQTGLVTMSAFCFSGFLMSILRGQYTSHEWLERVFVPFCTLVMCFPLLSLAKEAITFDLVELANSSNIVEFYMDELSEYGRYFLMFQVIGICTLILLATLSTVTFVHYLALMNQRESGSLYYFWTWVTRVTSRLSGNGAYVILIILLVVTALLLNGQIANWVTPG